ncbi:MAG: heavy metal translocating P-type ATPase, partial [Eubacteriales bacterium]|nr:heavy metal translocating P-type ATPase [Eubacteriales bacterium]
MNFEQKKQLIKIGLALGFFFVALLSPVNESLQLVLYIIGYLFVGYDVILSAIKNIVQGQVFDENFLMTIATLGAFFLGEYPEGIFVMAFYQLGEFFQSYGVDKSRKTISSLMDLCPDYANLMNNGSTEKVNPQDVKINDQILVKPGEKIPLDGVIINGQSV